MSDSLSSPVESWGCNEEKAFLCLVGLRLEAEHVGEEPAAVRDTVREITRKLIASDGEAGDDLPSVEDAVYAVARELVASESDAHAFGEDIVNVWFFQDFFWDNESMIWVGSDRGSGFSDGVMVLDFGSEKLVVARAPNGDMGRTEWLVLAVAEHGDTEALRSVVAGYIGQGWLPDSMWVTDLVPRVDVEAAFTTVLDAGHTNGWADLVRVLADLAPGVDFSVGSAEQRVVCLSAYLDIVLSQ